MSDTMELSQDVLICLFSFLDLQLLVAAGLVCKYVFSLACFYKYVNWLNVKAGHMTV